jgi:hypothetical protein
MSAVEHGCWTKTSPSPPKAVNLEDKYRRLRTDMEDMIDAHQENVKMWNILKEHCESNRLVVPSVNLPTMLQILLNPPTP